MAIIIGSGAGAGLLAMKLVKAGIPTTILEEGQHIEPKDAFKYNKEDENNYVGGTKEVAMANTSLELEKDLKEKGIDISAELSAVQSQIKTNGIDQSTISESTQKFIEMSKSESFNTKIVGKSVDALGKEFIQAGFDYALTIINDAENIEIVAENNEIVGVKYVKDGIDRIKYTKTVIIATGGESTIKLLKDANIEVNKSVCFNQSVCVGGELDIDSNDVAMNVIATGNDITLAPYYTCEGIEIMVKSNKISQGNINEEGKLVLNSDESLNAGIDLAKKILDELGVKEINVSEPKAINMIGSSAIGEIVNTNLETSVKGLFVCDVSVLPSIPEYPPVLSIAALSERLANYLENIDYDNNQYGKSDYGLGKSYGKMDGWWRENPQE